jgi:hypothetical protein
MKGKGEKGRKRNRTNSKKGKRADGMKQKQMLPLIIVTIIVI